MLLQWNVIPFSPRPQIVPPKSVLAVPQTLWGKFDEGAGRTQWNVAGVGSHTA